MLKYLIFPLVAMSCNLAFSQFNIQGKDQSSSQNQARRFSIGGHLDSLGRVAGPDPAKPEQLFEYLSNKSVRRELGLTDAQIEGITKVEQLGEESLQASMTRNRERGIQPTQQEVNAAAAARAEIRERGLREVLLPDQIKRLPQLAYHIDIGVVGLVNAFTDGRIGVAAGITEGQFASLKEKITRFEAAAREEHREVQRRLYNKILQELSSEQRTKATELLGEPFDYIPTSPSDMMREAIENRRGQRSKGK